MKKYIVKAGLSVWLGKIGDLILEEKDQIVIRIEGSDDGGPGMFDVRMPKESIEEYDAKKVKDKAKN